MLTGLGNSDQRRRVPVQQRDKADNMSFSKIDTWVFDLDDTLYPASSNFFPQVAERMGLYVAEAFDLPLAEAKLEQRRLFLEYGTTLSGLVAEHGIEVDAYARFLMQVDYGRIPRNPALVDAIARLPGRVLVFTNGFREHALACLDQLGFPPGSFEAIADIRTIDFKPKPRPVAFEIFFEVHGVDPHRSIFFEDSPRNLRTAKDVGMKTVHVLSDTDWGKMGLEDGDGFIDHSVVDLSDFLTETVLNTL